VKTLKPLLFLSLVTLGLSACAPKPAPVKPITKNISLSKSVTKLDVAGPYKVYVYDNARSSKVQIKGMPNVVNQIGVTASKTRVNISGNSPRAYRVNVYLRHLRDLKANGLDALMIQSRSHGHFNLVVANTRKINVSGNPTIPYLDLNGDANFSNHGFYLRKLVHKGMGNVRATGVRGKGVEIYAYGPGSVSLSGPFTPAKVVHRGTGQLTLNGIEGNDVVIDSQGPGDLRLAGIKLKTLQMDLKEGGYYYLSGRITNLRLNTYGHVYVNAKNLRAYNAYLQSYDRSAMSATALHRIFAKAAGASRIEYYGHPPYKYVEALSHSAVLPMSKE
jgi:hypothetical protein